MRFAIHGRQTKIPKVVGLTPTQAKKLLADHGLVLDEGDRFFSSDVPPGRILSQVPATGMQVRRGWHVRVAESIGPQRVVIPDLVGTSERAAEINLRHADALLVTVTGFDRGQLASAALDEIAAAIRLPQLQLFVDARAATGVVTAVREEWTAWLQQNQAHLSRVHILVSDRFMTSVMHVAQHLARLGALIQIHSDPATFEAASRA